MPNDLASALRPLRVGSRRSELALRQTALVREALHALGIATELTTFSTIGDERLDVPLPSIGGKGVFTAELEAALLSGAVDLCVHSLKDLPTESPPGLDVGAVLEREDPRDVLLVREAIPAHRRTVATLPDECRVGTSSLRRAALLRARRPDLALVDLRGNVPTRVRKMDAGEMDAIILAGAGLKRLGLAHRVSEWLDAPAWLPSPGQGIIAIQIRRDDARVRAMVRRVHHPDSWTAAVAERAMLRALEGGCQVPIGALMTVRQGGGGGGGGGWLDGIILDVDGGRPASGGLALDAKGAQATGERLASLLLADGGAALVARARGMTQAPASSGRT